MKQNNTVTNIEQAPKGSKPSSNPQHTLASAYLAFQKLNVSVDKDMTNPFHKNKYSSLEACLKACREANQFGLVHYYETTITENGNVIITAVMEHSGTREKRMVSVPVSCKDKSNPQQLGGGITYAKRYSIQALFALPSEDDDGNEASGVGTKPSTGDIKTKNPLQNKF